MVGIITVWRVFVTREDMYAQDSIELLTTSGIQFKKHEDEGIETLYFAELLMTSGVVLCDGVKWLSFHRYCAYEAIFVCRQLYFNCGNYTVDSCMASGIILVVHCVHEFHKLSVPGLTSLMVISLFACQLFNIKHLSDRMLTTIYILHSILYPNSPYYQCIMCLKVYNFSVYGLFYHVCTQTSSCV